MKRTCSMLLCKAAVAALIGINAHAAAGAPVLAKVELTPLFGDHAVLQRGPATGVWGTANPGEKVEVSVSSGITPANRICSYLESLRQQDGGYAYPGQDASHLSATYAAVMTHALLGRNVGGDTKALATLVAKGIHPVLSRPGESARTRWHWAILYEYRLQQVRILNALGESADMFRSEIDGYEKVDSYTTGYEENGNPVLVQLACVPLLKEACGLVVGDAARKNFTEYLKVRERANGSFNTTPASDGSDGHVVNTAYALAALRALGEKPDGRAASWILDCQREDGGFTWSPNPCMGGVSDVWYAWAAVRTLTSLGIRPRDEAGLRRWIVSLWNADGGFAPRPGMRSDPMATFRIVDMLCALGWMKGLVWSERANAVDAPHDNFANCHAWTVQFEAPGSGSVKDAVQIAKDLKIHLWGAKNALPGWVDAAQREADSIGVPVTFFHSDETYGKRRGIPGLGSFTHLLDPATPPPGAVEESVFNLWQICDHECCARIWLDSGQYDAIGTFHFGCFDMTWLLPFLYQYEGVLPFVSNQDSHGETWWWRDELSAFRTVFLAPGRSWDDFRDACRRGQVASVREDSHTENRLRIIGCSEQVKRALVERRSEWRGLRPSEQVSVQVLGPESMFEVGRPKSGRVLRVRIDYHWRENKGLISPSCRLVSAKSGNLELPVERIVMRHEKNDYLHGIIEEAYDIVRIDGELPQRIVLTFSSADGCSDLWFVKEVDVTR